MSTRSELVNNLNDPFEKNAFDINDAKSATHERVIERFWPTEASAQTPYGVVGGCRRSSYYSHQNLPRKPWTINGLYRCEFGNLAEDWWVDRCKTIGVWHSNSIKIRYPNPVNEKVVISGEVDVVYDINGEIVGGEIKSSHGYTFTSHVFHKKTVPGLPMIYHLMQVMMYLYYHKNVDADLGIDKYIITYIDRGSMDVMHHVIELDGDIPVVNGIKMVGIQDYSNPIFGVERLHVEKTQKKLRDFEINIQDIFNRYNQVYEHLESGLLISKDYDPMYSDQVIADKFIAGDLSKSRYNDFKSGKLAYLCDTRCGWCDYRERCMKDEGLI